MALESEKKSRVNWRELISQGAAIAILAGLVGAYLVIIRPAPSASTVLVLVGIAVAFMWFGGTRIGKISDSYAESALEYALYFVIWAVLSLVVFALRVAVVVGLLVAAFLVIRAYV
jgi:hypothetical protein